MSQAWIPFIGAAFGLVVGGIVIALVWWFSSAAEAGRWFK